MGGIKSKEKERNGDSFRERHFSDFLNLFKKEGLSMAERREKIEKGDRPLHCYVKRSGEFMVEYAAVGALVVATLALVLKYAQQNKELWVEHNGIENQQLAIKETAPLVVVGRIENIYETIQYRQETVSQEIGLLFYDVAVDAVERGFYDEPRMSVLVKEYDRQRGAYVDDPSRSSMSENNSFLSSEAAHPYLKKKYGKGDKVRLFVHFDAQRKVYFLKDGWYMIEPLESEKNEI